MITVLSQAQAQVIAGLARGHTAPRIGHDLTISPCTVQTRIRRAADRAGLRGRPQPQLVDYAYRHGYLAGLVPELRSPVMLSQRQRDVLDGLSSGLSVEELAAEMGVGRDTAHEYRKRLYGVLGVRTRGHAVVLGWQAGLFGELVHRSGGVRTNRRGIGPSLPGFCALFHGLPSIAKRSIR
ncbi:LuxR C-terminal-related transcriptional regulator [Streptomyces sp. NPDC005125]